MATRTAAPLSPVDGRAPVEWEALLPDEGDVGSYEENGYWVSGKILPEQLIDAAVDGAHRHWAGERDWRLPIESGFGDWSAADGETLRNSEYVSLQNRQVRNLVHFPLIGMIAARLSRSGTIRLWDDQLVSKPPLDGSSAPVVGWHSDRAYWMTCTSPDMLTAWIPLHDCPPEMGPVTYLAGSHRWPNAEKVRHFNAETLSNLELGPNPDEIDSLKRVIVLEKGQVSFHHSRLVHGSDVNRSDRPRTSIALHMQDERNRYRTYLNEAGQVWRLPNDEMCRTDASGQPDYSDPAVFPVMFGRGRDDQW